MKKIGVLGAGSWGTALTWLLTNNGHEVTLWSHKKRTYFQTSGCKTAGQHSADK